jgi:hypothetical protein
MVLPPAPPGCSWVPVVAKVARHHARHHIWPRVKHVVRRSVHHVRRAVHHVVHHVATPAAYKLVCVATGVAIGASVPTANVGQGVVADWPQTPNYTRLPYPPVPYVQGGGWAYDRGIYASLPPSYAGGGSWPNVVPPGSHTSGFPTPTPPESIVEPSALLVFGGAVLLLAFVRRRA